MARCRSHQPHEPSVVTLSHMTALHDQGHLSSGRTTPWSPGPKLSQQTNYLRKQRNLTVLEAYWRRLVQNIGGNQNIGGVKRVVITGESTDVSQLLGGGTCPGCSQRICLIAYALAIILSLPRYFSSSFYSLLKTFLFAQ